MPYEAAITRKSGDSAQKERCFYMIMTLRSSRMRPFLAAVMAFFLTVPFAWMRPAAVSATKNTGTAGTVFQAAVQELNLLFPEHKSVQEARLLTGITLRRQAESLERSRREQLAAAREAQEETARIYEERRQAAAEAARREAERLAEEARLEKERQEAAARRQAVIACSEEDYEVLKRIVQAEAGGCDMEGKILVANVVMNRVQSGKFPDTVTEVVYQKSQFSPVGNGSINRCSVTAETTEAVDRALAGEDYSRGALYFMNRRASYSGNVRWFDNHLTYLFSHGGHEFFR